MINSGRPRVRLGFTLLGSVLCVWVQGCATHKPVAPPQPVMGAGEGAIAGKLVDSDGQPFDLALASQGGTVAATPLEIKLISPDRAVAATTSPWMNKPQFTFDHVRPGTYEMTVYRVVPGKRTLAGSEPVTVDAGQVAPATLTIQVKNEGEEKSAG